MTIVPTKRNRALFDALPREATLASRVIQQMESIIAQGALADGSRLPPERDLAAQFGVSRTVIREAVAALSARGLLEVQSGSGTVVKRPAIESIAGLVSLRMSIGGEPAGPQRAESIREAARSLAGEAAGMAADRRTDDDLEHLTHAARRPLDDHSADHGPTFLSAVGAAAHNSALSTVLEILLSLCDPVDMERAERQSRLALDPIRKSDAKSARRILRDMFDDPEPIIAPKAASKKERKAARLDA